MAAAVTALAAVSTSTSNTTSYAGTAGTPASGDLLIAFVVAATTVETAPTMTGTWTWNLLYRFTFNAGADTVFVFWAKATAATATTPTFNCPNDAGANCMISVMRITGVEGMSQPYIRQIKSSNGTGANPAIVLDKAPLTANLMLGLACNITNVAAEWTAPQTAAWTELHETAASTPSNTLETCYRLSGETSATITWVNAQTVAWGLLVMELYIAGSGPTEGDPMGAMGFMGMAA